MLPPYDEVTAQPLRESWVLSLSPSFLTQLWVVQGHLMYEHIACRCGTTPEHFYSSDCEAG